MPGIDDELNGLQGNVCILHLSVPVGPLILSIQPGMGSLRLAVTMDGRMMDRGIFPSHSFNKRSSAMNLVKVYVFG